MSLSFVCDKATMAATLHDCRFAGGISASGQSAGFGGNLFTRDALRVVADLVGMAHYKSFCRETLTTLPQWQGVKENPATNEFPDAMQHQVFRQIVGGLAMPDSQLEAVEYWTSKWGVTLEDHPLNGKQFTVYNSSDAPMLYLTTLSRYCRLYGENTILKDKFRHHATGEMRTVAEAARRCAHYIVRWIEYNEDKDLIGGLYGVPNTNPHQTSPSGVMRDGFDSYIRPNGSVIDYSHAAYVENQALAYDALNAAVWLFPSDEYTNKWSQVANRLRQRTIDLLWHDNFFDAAFDKHGVVEMPSSAAFEMLNSSIFSNLEDGPDYVAALVRRLYRPDFMTTIGVRMTSLNYAHQEADYYAYQGSGAVWGVTNGLVANGLYSQGFGYLALDIGSRMITWFSREGSAVELSYVDRQTGVPLYKGHRGLHNSEGRTICAAELGQPNQAWSASAALQALHLQDFPASYLGDRHSKLQKEVLEMAHSTPVTTGHGPSLSVQVDLERGKRLKVKRAQQLGAVY